MLEARYQLSEQQARMREDAHRLVGKGRGGVAERASPVPGRDDRFPRGCAAVSHVEAVAVHFTSQRTPRYALALLEKQSVTCTAIRTLATPSARDETDALANLRVRHPDALVRFADDDADSLHAVARDPRLLSLELFFAS